jgi:ABC-type transport system involved in multi-copper enzyme maturation permease subunit
MLSKYGGFFFLFIVASWSALPFFSLFCFGRKQNSNNYSHFVLFYVKYYLAQHP